MTQDEIIEMARQAGWPDSLVAPIIMAKLNDFAKLVEEKATEEANARANASWTLMCKKMVALEREACAKVCDDIHANYEAEDVFSSYAEAIRARGEQA